MVLQQYLELLIPEINSGLKSTIQKDIPETFSLLQEMMLYHFGWFDKNRPQGSHGKRIRPLLLLLSNIVCGGDWKKTLPAAIAIELIHNFSLLHDDIEDRSDLRHGRKTAWVVYGTSQAINAGDAMFSLAQINMLKIGDSINKMLGFEALAKLNETCLVLTGGQSLDISFENKRIISLEQYLSMIQGKTAALISASCEIGAILAEAAEGDIKLFKKYGEALGLAFQAWDDWLGIWGKEEITGKSNMSDLLTGKKTLPILYALDKKGDFSEVYLKQGVSKENFDQLVSLLEAEGAKTYTEKLARKYTNESLSALNKIERKNQDAFDGLIELTSLLIQRKE